MENFERLDVAIENGAGIVVRRYVKKSAPRLLLCHGNGFAIGGYRKFWELLRADFELCLFDLRNHGANPLGPLEGHTLAAMARDHVAVKEAVAEAFGARPTLGLFHSVASIAAIRAARDHGACWDALVLFDPPLIAPPGNPLREMNEKLDETLASFARKRPHHFASIEDLATQFRQRLGRTWAEGVEFDMAAATTRKTADGYELACPGEYEARIYADNAAFDSYDAMSALKQPAFLICADPQAPRALAPAFSGPEAARKFGFGSVNIPGTGHLLQIEQPAIAAQHARDFIASLKFA